MSGNAHVRCETGENPETISKDYLSSLPKIESAEMMFSASRSRRMSIVPIIQSFAQLEKNYGKEGAEIIVDNTQLTIFGGFAPNSESAQILSKALGTQTVMSGSVSKGKESSESLQMIERPLMTPDELKSMPKGVFVVMKTGAHPMKVRLKLFFEWGIQFLTPYRTEERAGRKVAYASREKLIDSVRKAYSDTPEKPLVDHSKPTERNHVLVRTDSFDDTVSEESRMYFSEVEDKKKQQNRQTGSERREAAAGVVRVEHSAKAVVDPPKAENPPKPVEALPMDDLPDRPQEANDTPDDGTGKAGDDK